MYKGNRFWSESWGSISRIICTLKSGRCRLRRTTAAAAFATASSAGWLDGSLGGGVLTAKDEANVTEEKAKRRCFPAGVACRCLQVAYHGKAFC